MTIRETIKTWFARGCRPTAAQFSEVLDSYVHKEDSIAMSKVTNLTATLNGITNPTGDTACGEKSLGYNMQAVPKFADIIDLSLPYRRQVVEIQEDLGNVVLTDMTEEAIEVILINKTAQAYDVMSKVGSGVTVLGSTPANLPSGGTAIYRFMKVISGSGEYDPENVSLCVAIIQ